MGWNEESIWMEEEKCEKKDENLMGREGWGI